MMRTGSTASSIDVESMEMEYWLHRTENLAREERARSTKSATSIKLGGPRTAGAGMAPRQSGSTGRALSTAASSSAPQTTAARRRQQQQQWQRRTLTNQGLFIFLVVLYFPLLAVLLVPFLGLLFTLLGTPAAVWGLYVVAGVSSLEQHFESDHWSPHKFPRGAKILRNLSAVLFFPLMLALFLVAVVALQPIFLILWSPVLLLYTAACMMCVRDRRRFLANLGNAFRDAIDLCVLMAVRALFPWLHSTPIDDAERDTIDVVHNSCGHTLRVLAAAVAIAVLQVALPIFDTVTDVLFMLEMIARYELGIPPAADAYYLSMVCLSGIASGVNLVIHVLWLGMLFKFFWTSYSLTEVIWAVSPQFLVPQRHRRRIQRAKAAAAVSSPSTTLGQKQQPYGAGAEAFDLADDDDVTVVRLPWWMPFTIIVKVIFGDVLHIVVLCMTFGFFGSTPSIPWLLNVIAAVASVGMLLGDAFTNLMFSRVIHNTLALAFLQTVATVEFMAAVSAPLLLLLLYPSSMFGSSVCSIPWQATDLTDSLLTMIADSCTSVSFDLVIRNSSASAWVFPLLTSAVYIHIASNSHLNAVQFPALKALSYPAHSGYDVTSANLAGASQMVLWCAQSVLGDVCTGVCCSGSGVVIESNPVLTTVAFPLLLTSAPFDVGEVVDGDPAYDTIETYDALNSRRIAELEVDTVRIVNNPYLASVALGFNSTVGWVEVAGNARLQTAALTLNGLFVYVASNPALTSLTLTVAPVDKDSTLILGSAAVSAGLLARLRGFLPSAYLAPVTEPDAYSHQLHSLWGYAGLVVFNNSALINADLSTWAAVAPLGQLPDSQLGVISKTFLVVAGNANLQLLTLPQLPLGQHEYLLVNVTGNAHLVAVLGQPAATAVCNCTVAQCVPPTRATVQIGGFVGC